MPRSTPHPTGPTIGASPSIQHPQPSIKWLDKDAPSRSLLIIGFGALAVLVWWGWLGFVGWVFWVGLVAVAGLVGGGRVFGGF